MKHGIGYSKRTRHFSVFLIALAVAAGAALAVAGLTPSAAHVERWRSAQHDHRGAGQGSAWLCGSERRHLEAMLAYAKVSIGVTAVQTEPWSELTEALRGAHVTIGRICEDLTAEGVAAAPEKLARMEAAVAAGLEALRGIRPSFERFYGTLEADQRQRLDALMSPHGPH